MKKSTKPDLCTQIDDRKQRASEQRFDAEETRFRRAILNEHGEAMTGDGQMRLTLPRGQAVARALDLAQALGGGANWGEAISVFVTAPELAQQLLRAYGEVLELRREISEALKALHITVVDEE